MAGAGRRLRHRGRTAEPGDALPWATVAGWLADARNYWLCTARADGPPHVKPVWALWMDGALVFSTSPESVERAPPARRSRGRRSHLEGEHVAVVEGVVEPLAAAPDGFVEAYEAKYGWRMDPADPARRCSRSSARRS